MSNFLDYRVESRKTYGCRNQSNLERDQLQFGALLRIADASEAMAKRHIELIDENARLQNLKMYAENRLKVEEQTSRALRGVITKLKKQIEHLKNGD